jgi:2-phosphosulfolactate phosphatase
MGKQNLEVCFSPALYHKYRNSESIVVIIDVLRASSAICTAFENGASSIIPVAEVEQAKEYKSKGYLVAAERDGWVLDFADFGNSPFNFTSGKVKGRTIAYSTTNGTRVIDLASGSSETVIGCFLNISALCKWLETQGRDVVLFCAGWKDKFNLEDSVCAGAFSLKLLSGSVFTTNCDSVHASLDLWEKAVSDPLMYVEKAAQRSRLRDKGLDDCIEYCLKMDVTTKIPILRNGILVDLEQANN